MCDINADVAGWLAAYAKSHDGASRKFAPMPSAVVIVVANATPLSLHYMTLVSGERMKLRFPLIPPTSLQPRLVDHDQYSYFYFALLLLIIYPLIHHDSNSYYDYEWLLWLFIIVS